MPAKELTPEQRADAARLKRAWEAWKATRRARGEPATQEHVAHELGFKTQSAVSQYLNGDIPLNAEALRKFGRLFGVGLTAISPSLVARQRAEFQDWLAAEKAEWFPPEVSVTKAAKPAKKGKR